MAGPHKGLSTIKQILRASNKPNQIFLLSALNKAVHTHKLPRNLHLRSAVRRGQMHADTSGLVAWWARAN